MAGGRRRRRGSRITVVELATDGAAAPRQPAAEPARKKQRRQPQQPQQQQQRRRPGQQQPAQQPPPEQQQQPQQQEQCFWCVAPIEDDLGDGRCPACRAKYEPEPGDARREGATHTCFVTRRLATATPRQAQAAAWQQRQLRDCFGAGAVESAAGGSGGERPWLELRVGPFVLVSSGVQGQVMEEFCAAVTAANEVVEALLDCFACLAAKRGRAPEVTHAECNACHAFLEAELAQLQAVGGGSREAKGPVVCVRDAMKNLKVMVDDTPPLSDEHRQVHTSKPLLSPAECKRVIASAVRYARDNGGWTTKRHIAYPTHDLPTAVLGTAGELSTHAVETKLLPELAGRFALDLSKLSIQEMFVAKYSADPGGLKQLEEHEDDSKWSFVLALNDGEEHYGGGGTRFVELEGAPVFRPRVGSASMFSGKNRHCGVATTAGTRYILAGFLKYG